MILRNSGRTFDEFEFVTPISDLRRKSMALFIDVVTKGMANGEFRDDVDGQRLPNTT